MKNFFVISALLGAAQAVDKHHQISKEIDAIANSTISESQFKVSNATMGSNQSAVVDRNMTKNSTSDQFVNLVEKLNQAEKANKNVFDNMNSKLQDTEFVMVPGIGGLSKAEVADATTDKDEIHYDPYWGMEKAKLAALSSNSPSGLSDADVKCYGERYSDITGDPRQHFINIGEDTGRLGTCAEELSKYESQALLDRKPDLQRAYGKKSKYSNTMAKQWYTDIGFAKEGKFKIDAWDNEPDFCVDASKGYSTNRCYCPGILYYGAKTDPLTKETITTLDHLKQWLHAEKESEEYVDCSYSGVGLKKDLYDDIDKQCWCEYKPAYNPSKAADEGEPVTCKGQVYFMQKDLPSGGDSSWNEGLSNAFTINDWNNTSKNHTCSSASFEGVDPLPGKEKACFCDDERQMASKDQENAVKEWWRGVMAQQAAEEEVASRKAEAKAARAAARIAEAERVAEEKATAEAKALAEKQRREADEAERLAAEAEEAAKKAAAKKRLDEERAAAKAVRKAAQEAAKAARKLENEAEQKRKQAMKLKKAERRKMLREAEKEKKEAVKAAVDAALAEAKANQNEEKAEYREEQQRLKAERQKKDREDRKAKREAARLAKKKARLEKNRKEAARKAARAEEKAAEAAKIASETERKITLAIEAKQKAYDEKQRLEKERRAKAQAKKKAEEDAAQAEKDARQQEAEDRKRRAAIKAAEQKAAAAEADQRMKEMEKAEQEEAQKIQMEEAQKAREEQAARIAKKKAEKALALAQSTEEQKAAEEQQARAEAALEKAKQEKAKLQAQKAAKIQELNDQKAKAKMAREAVAQAEAEQAASEKAAALAKKRAQDAKAKAAAAIAKAQKEAEEFEAELAREKAAQKARHELALKAQQASLKESEDAQRQARAAADASRAQQGEQQKAYLAQMMTERLAQFENNFSNTWSTGLPGIHLFWLTTDMSIEKNDDLVKSLFNKRLIADIEEYKMDSTLKVMFTQDGKMESHTEETKFIGICAEDKVDELSDAISEHFKGHLRLGKFPSFDLTTFPIATGDVKYLEWAIEETAKEAKDKTELAF